MTPAADKAVGLDGRPATSDALAISIVVPVYDEQENLEPLWRRLAPVLDGLAGGVEAIFVNDGSRDRSLEILEGLARRDPRLRVIAFPENRGQHAAVLAGFAAARGASIVTLDADLQNPPEEIPKLLAKLDEGFDHVAGRRIARAAPL